MFGTAQNTNTNNDIKIVNSAHYPNDTVECIKFAPVTPSTTFATADWSGTVKLYQIASQNGQSGIGQQAEVNVGAPIFSLSWVTTPSPMIIVGCCDGSIKAINP